MRECLDATLNSAPVKVQLLDMHSKVKANCIKVYNEDVIRRLDGTHFINRKAFLNAEGFVCYLIPILFAHQSMLSFLAVGSTQTSSFLSTLETCAYASARTVRMMPANLEHFTEAYLQKLKQFFVYGLPLRFTRYHIYNNPVTCHTQQWHLL
jgi:hypothetical protein